MMTSTECEDDVVLIVGGVQYIIPTSDLLKHSDSFFVGLLKKEWKPSNCTHITIQRDGKIFKYIYAYLITGHLPRHLDGTIALDVSVVNLIKDEADFYNLPVLIKECEANSPPSEVFANLPGFSTVRSYIKSAKQLISCNKIPVFAGQFSSKDPLALVNVLGSVWAPFCIRGSIYCCSGGKLFKSSTIAQLKIEELLTEANQSPFGKGLETVIDTAVRDSFEIEASKLNANTLKDIEQMMYDVSNLVPHRKVELRPYKLVIYQEGGHFEQHRDTVRGDNHIGTAVVILNSEYTGGELEISHGGRTEVVTGPYSWVAMYGDCLHKINPITSGTRVSLIYDIYAEEPAPLTGEAAEHADAEGMDGEHGQQSGGEHEGGSEGEEGQERAEEGGDEQADVEQELEGEEEALEDDGDYDDDDDNDFEDGDDYDDYDGYDDYEDDGVSSSGWAIAVHKKLVNDTLTPSAAQQHRIFTALNMELKQYDSVIICLAHMYPACQANPSFLKGGDLTLYELLSDKYNVTVELVSMCAHRHNEVSPACVSAAMVRDVELFRATKKAKAGGVHCSAEQRRQCFGGDDGDNDDSDSDRCAMYAPAPPMKVPIVKFVIPCGTDATSVLDYSPYIEHTGNESQSEATVYVVVGLQVSKLTEAEN